MKKEQLNETLLQILTDPENQPHQYVGRKEELKQDILKFIEAQPTADVEPTKLPTEWFALKGYLESLKDFTNHTDSYIERLFDHYIPNLEVAFEPKADVELVEILKDLAISQDAHRICDMDKTINFKEQLERSKKYINNYIKQALTKGV